MNKLNNKGLGHHLLLLVVAVVAVVGAAGYFVWQRQKDSGIDAKAQVGCLQRLNKGARDNSKSKCVAHIQTFLNELNNAKLTVDGVFGAKTEEAVKNYQKANKLTVDGIVATAETWPSFCKNAEDKFSNLKVVEAYVGVGCDRKNYVFVANPRLTACIIDNKTMKFVNAASQPKGFGATSSKWHVSFTNTNNIFKEKGSIDQTAKKTVEVFTSVFEDQLSKSTVKNIEVRGTYVSSSIDSSKINDWKYIGVSTIPKCEY